MNNSRATWILGAALFALALAFVLWRLTVLDTPPRGFEAGSHEQSRELSLASHSKPLVPAAGVPKEPERTHMRTAVQDELESAIWVEGRVVLPPGTPDDEVCTVTANGRNFSDGRDHRVVAEPDGSFRVAFREGTRMGRLTLDGLYLYMNASVRMRVDEHSGPVELRPQLGGRVLGRLRTEETGGRLCRGGDLRLGKRKAPAQGSSLEFVFNQVVPSPSLTLTYTDECFLAEASFALAAGETRTVDLVPLAGFALAGVVTDQDGLPVGGASLSTRHSSTVRSASDGSFRFPAQEDGQRELKVRHDGFLPATVDLGFTSAGEKREDLVVVLDHGFSISGFVRHPGGSLRRVRLDILRQGATGRHTVLRTRIDEDGNFLCSGLLEGSYGVRAKSREGSGFVVRIDDVQAGTDDLEVFLSGGLELVGRVVDSGGQPIDSFRLKVKGPANASFSRSFTAPDGVFRMPGLSAGPWIVEVTRGSRITSGEVEVHLPQDRPLVQVLQRGTTIEGVVLDTGGRPRQGVSIYTRLVEVEGSSQYLGDSDKEGQFLVHDEREGKAAVRAGSNGMEAPSEEVEVDLREGAHGRRLTLRLRAWSSVTGRVVAPAGVSVEGVRVSVLRSSQQHSYEYSQDMYGRDPSTRTDSKGRFEFKAAAPGRISIRAASEVGTFTQTVALEAGMNRYVEIALVAGPTVSVHGHVGLSGGSAIRGKLTFEPTPRSTSGLASIDARMTSAGEYSVELPAADYAVKIHARLGRGFTPTLSWSGRIRVAPSEKLVRDFNIPVGRIMGRLIDLNGKLAAARDDRQGVFTEHPLVIAKASDGTSNGGACECAEDSSFDLIVPEGTYTLAPDDAWEGLTFSGGKGVVVRAGDVLRGIELVVE